MGPVRNSQSAKRSAPYDRTLPENWTVAKLQDELSKKGVNYPKNAKRSYLISLFKVASEETNTNSTETTLPAVVPNVLNTELLNMVKELSSSVHVLQSNVNKLIQALKSSDSQQDISIAASTDQQKSNNTVTSGRIIPAAAGSEQQLNSNNAENMGNTLHSANSSTTVQSPAVGQTNQTKDYVKTRFGYAAESLPFVETVTPQLRNKITEGKDVNLAMLLIPYYTDSKDSKENSGRPDPRLSKQLNLGEFITAFGIFKSILCEAHPHRRVELDLYERDIVDMATRYGGTAFYEYHKQFSARAAAHLKYQNLQVDWSVRNNTLFCNIFANHKPITCYMCSSISHTAAFCPQAVHSGFRYQPQERYRYTDTYGRQRLTFAGQEICNNFNGEKGCVRPRCNNLHICLICKKDHPKLKCSESKNLSAPKVLHSKSRH